MLGLFNSRQIQLVGSDELSSMWNNSVVTRYNLDHCRENIIQCRRKTTIIGDVFIVTMFYEFPIGCSTAACQHREAKRVYKRIKTDNNEITISITFTNGQTIVVGLLFCSFDPFATGTSETSLVDM